MTAGALADPWEGRTHARNGPRHPCNQQGRVPGFDEGSHHTFAFLGIKQSLETHKQDKEVCEQM